MSANVDFSLIKSALDNCNETNDSLSANFELMIHGPVMQETFLHNMGIQSRLKMLMKSFLESETKSPSLDRATKFKNELESTYHRLTNHKEMGKYYKFLGVTTISKKE